MRRALLAGAAFAALMSGSALAADLAPYPTKARPMVAPLFSWSGFYVGLNAGYGFGDDSNVVTTGNGANAANVASGARPGNTRLSSDGFVGGAQAGYNWQFGPWVAGIEADIQYADIRDSFDNRTNVGGVRSNTFTTELEYFGTVRGRLGYAWDRTLFYGTGGFAYGGVRNSASFSAIGPGVEQFAGGVSRTETGYAVGGGIEHAFGFNWTAKIEYLYYDLGNTTILVANTPAGAGSYNSTFKNDGHIVRAGLNYKFGW